MTSRPEAGERRHLEEAHADPAAKGASAFVGGLAARSRVCLDLGCGTRKPPGFIGVDRKPMPGVDVVADLDRPLPFADDSVDLVLASHALEHVADLVAVMREVYRICRHRAEVCIVAPYAGQKLNLANPHHRVAFNEHTPRFWTADPTASIAPEEYAHPHARSWGLSRSDHSDPGIDFRLLRMEFFYFPPYRALDPDTQRRLRSERWDVCDQILYNLVVWKASGPMKTTDRPRHPYEPDHVTERREADRAAVRPAVEGRRGDLELAAEGGAEAAADKAATARERQLRAALERRDEMTRALAEDLQGARVLVDAYRDRSRARAPAGIPVSRLVEPRRVFRAPDHPRRPRVSVLMPTYRLRGVLNQRAMESVLSQSFADLELIVVDDGSLDGLQHLLLDYQRRDPRITIVRHEHNCGLPAVRVNEAASLARGELVAYMFEDDAWYPDALRSLVEAHDGPARRRPVYGAVEAYAAGSDRPQRLIGDRPFNYGLLKGANYIPNCAVLHERALFDRCGLFDPHVLLRRLTDWDLWLRMGRCVPFHQVDAVIGRVTLRQAHSLGATVEIDHAAARTLIESRRDGELSPSVIDDYIVDSLPRSLDEAARRRVLEREILPFWAKFGENLEPDERRSLKARQSEPRRVLVVKTDFSTSVDVTIGNFAQVLPRGCWSHAFFPEREASLPAPADFDAVILYRTVQPATCDLVSRFRAGGVPVLYFIDDNMFKFGAGYMQGEHAYLQPGSPLYDALERQVAEADLVASYSPVISKECRARNPRVVELSTNIPSRWIRSAAPASGASGRRVRYALLTGEARRRELTALWPQLVEFSRRHPERIEVHVWGIDVAGLEALACPVATRAFSHAYDEYLRALQGAGFDFVLCPLADDHDTKRAKSPVKYLEATAAGAVGVFSSATAYDGVADGLTGLKVSDEDWLKALERTLALTADERRRIWARAQQDVLQRYATETQQLAFLSAFEAAQLHAWLGSREAPEGKARIAYFFHESALGGATLHLLSHAQIAARYGFAPVLCVPSQGRLDPDFVARAAELGAKVARLDYAATVWARDVDAGDVRVDALSTWLLAERVAAVHFVTFCAEVAAAAGRLGLPVVATLHHYYERPAGSGAAEKTPPAKPAIAAVHSSSVRYAREWEAALGVEASVIRAPVPAPYFERFQEALPRERRPPTVLVAGTLQPRKRQLDAIRAVAALRDRGIAVRLHLVGYDDRVPEYAQQCRAAVESLGIGDAVKFSGFLAAPEEAYAQADFLLCASDEESMPQSVLKAMALGVRVITTSVGGIAEVLRDGFSAVFATGSDASDLAQAIERAIALDETTWRAMRRNAHSAARLLCSLEAVSLDLLRLYNRACRAALGLPRSQPRAGLIGADTRASAIAQGEQRVRQLEALVAAAGRDIADLRQRLADRARQADLRLAEDASARESNRTRIRRIYQRVAARDDLWQQMSPLFAEFREALEQDGGAPAGYRLVPGPDLRCRPFLEYSLRPSAGRVESIGLAPVLEVPGTRGVLGIEVVSPEDRIVGQHVRPIEAAVRDEPFYIPTSGLEFDGRPGWRLRVFAWEADAPVRVFELQRRRLFGLLENRRLAFAHLRPGPAPPCDATRVLAVCGGQIPTVELVANGPFRELERRGWCAYRFRTLSQVVARDLEWSDVLFLIRPGSTQDVLLARTARSMERRVIAYADDDLLSVPPIAASHPHYSRPGVQQAIKDALRLGDAVCSSSRRLLAKLVDISGRPGVLLPPVAMAAGMQRAPGRGANGAPLVGFAGSIDHRAALQELLLPAILRLWEQGLDFRFECVGPEPEVPARWRDRVGWRPHTASYEEWLQVRQGLGWTLGLAVVPEGEFYRHKFHNKLLEYGAAGIPAIFSAVPPYTDVVEYGTLGFLAENTVDGWAREIRRCLEDPEGLERVAQSAFDYVRQHHGLDAVCDAYREGLSRLLDHRAPARRTARSLRIRQALAWAEENGLRRLPLRLFAELKIRMRAL